MTAGNIGAAVGAEVGTAIRVVDGTLIGAEAGLQLVALSVASWERQLGPSVPLLELPLGLPLVRRAEHLWAFGLDGTLASWSAASRGSPAHLP
jgi:hypothetical protein